MYPIFRTLCKTIDLYFPYYQFNVCPWLFLYLCFKFKFIHLFVIYVVMHLIPYLLCMISISYVTHDTMHGDNNTYTFSIWQLKFEVHIKPRVKWNSFLLLTISYYILKEPIFMHKLICILYNSEFYYATIDRVWNLDPAKWRVYEKASI